MKNIAFLKRRLFFLNLMISYIALLIIITIVGSIVYIKTVKIIEEDVTKSNQYTLKQAISVLDARFREVDNIVNQISMDPTVNAFAKLNPPLDSLDYYNLLEMNRKFTFYNQFNSFTDNTFIYFKDSGVLLAKDFATSKVNLIFSSIFNYEGIPYEKWRTKLFGSYYKREYWTSTTPVDSNVSRNAITYMQSLPMDDLKKPKAVIIVKINESQLKQCISSVNIGPEGWVCVTDPSGHMITTINPGKKNIWLPGIDMGKNGSIFEQTINGEKMTIVYQRSGYNGLRYVVAVPTAFYLYKVNTIKTWYLNISLTMLLLGLIAAAFLSYWNNLPIRNLVKRTKAYLNIKTEAKLDGFNFIEATITNLLYNSKYLEEEIKKQAPLVRASFYNQLLNGGFYNEQEIASHLIHINEKIEGDSFVVFLMYFSSFDNGVSPQILEELNIARALATNLLKQYFGKGCIVHNIENEKIAVILALNKGDRMFKSDDLMKGLEHISEEICNKYKIEIATGVGTEYQRLIEVSNSFQEARRSLEYRQHQSRQRVFRYDSIYIANTGYYYPLELEMRLCNLAKTGLNREASLLLETVYAKNFIENFLSDYERQQLFLEIRGTILKIRADVFPCGLQDLLQLDNLIKAFDAYKEIDEKIAVITEIFSYICTTVNNKKKSHNVQLIEKILDYIQNHYMENSLSLTSICEIFDLTENYLSSFFKEQTGEKFAAYLRKIRIEKSKKIMRDTKRKISDIAADVGYCTDNSFYRAFKEVSGMSPDDYRKQTREDKVLWINP